MSYCLCTLYLHCGTGVVCVATVNISSYSNYATTDNLPCIPTCGGSRLSFWSVHEPSVNHVCLKMADLHVDVMQCQLGHASANTVSFMQCTWLWYKISNISHQKQVYIVFLSMSPTVQGVFQPIPSPMACQPSYATLGQLYKVQLKV